MVVPSPNPPPTCSHLLPYIESSDGLSRGDRFLGHYFANKDNTLLRSVDEIDNPLCIL